MSFATPIGEDEEIHPGDFVADKGVVSPSDAAHPSQLEGAFGFRVENPSHVRKESLDALWVRTRR